MAVPPMLVALLEGFRIRLLHQAVKCGQQTAFEWVLLRLDRTEIRGGHRLEGLDEGMRLSLESMESLMLQMLLR